MSQERTPIDISRITNAQIKKYEGSVGPIVSKFLRKVPANVERDDLFNAGRLAVAISLARRQDDPEVSAEHNELRFRAFLITRIQGQILDLLRTDDPLSRSDRRIVKEMQRMQADTQAQKSDPSQSTALNLSSPTPYDFLDTPTYSASTVKSNTLSQALDKVPGYTDNAQIDMLSDDDTAPDANLDDATHTALDSEADADEFLSTSDSVDLGPAADPQDPVADKMVKALIKKGFSMPAIKSALLARTHQVVSLDEPMGEDGDTFGSTLEDAGTMATNPESALHAKHLLQLVEKFVAKLPYREQAVLTLHWESKIPHQEIAKVFEVSPSRIAQIITQSLEKLKVYLARHDNPIPSGYFASDHLMDSFNEHKSYPYKDTHASLANETGNSSLTIAHTPAVKGSLNPSTSLNSQKTIRVAGKETPVSLQLTDAPVKLDQWDSSLQAQKNPLRHEADFSLTHTSLISHPPVAPNGEPQASVVIKERKKSKPKEDRNATWAAARPAESNEYSFDAFVALKVLSRKEEMLLTDYYVKQKDPEFMGLGLGMETKDVLATIAQASHKVQQVDLARFSRRFGYFYETLLEKIHTTRTTEQGAVDDTGTPASVSFKDRLPGMRADSSAFQSRPAASPDMSDIIKGSKF